ncbi:MULTISPECIES: lipopolysaccharide biosynthesis protein [unclassified Microbacterium]|uniref:lipopolysaccharide biosynthesis protein n=1 Tax=unclassified Microbacterium TaxID=2609290 RepID=UPI0025EBC3B2|nr:MULTISPECIES: hypothetical protein [unclassified Microbacterium]
MRNLVKAVSAMIAGSGAQLAANALAGFLATAWLPVAERGLMILALSASAIVSLLVSAGIGNTLRARLPRANHEEAVELRRAFTTAGLIVIVVSAVVGGGAAVLLQGTDARMATAPIIAAVALATSSQVGIALLTDARFAGMRYAAGARWAAGSAVAGLLSLGLALALCAGGGITPTAALLVAAQYGAVAVVAVVSVVFAFRDGDLMSGWASALRVSRLFVAGVSTLVLPLAIVVIARSDRLILGAVTSATVVAVYGLAATYAEVIRVVPTAVAQLAPARVAGGGGSRSVAGLAVLSVLATAVTAAVVGLAATWLTVPLFGTPYTDAVAITWLLLPGEVFYALVVLANLVLIGGEWNRAATLVGLSSVPVALVLYSVGAMLGGAEGLAVARDLVLAVMAIAGGIAVYVVFRRRRPGLTAPEQGRPMPVNPPAPTV